MFCIVQQHTKWPCYGDTGICCYSSSSSKFLSRCRPILEYDRLFIFQAWSGVVWQQLSQLTMTQICIQTQHAIEAAPTYNILESRKTQLNQLYFAILQKTKGGKSHSRFLYDSTPEFLQGIYRLYKLLRQLKFNMPIFGQFH